MTKLLNARILASLGMIVFVAAIVASATGAFFSDEETSTGNTFTAGEVDLEITDLSHIYNGDPGNAPEFTDDGISFDLADMKPLDNGTITYDLENSSNEVHLCAAVAETGNNDNGINEPEGEAGDVTDGDGNGELGQFLSFLFGSTTSTLDGSWQSLGILGGGDTASSSIEYCFGDFVGGSCQLDPGAEYNLAQTDSLTADVHFYAVQTRNNADFQCSDLPPVNGTTTPPTVAVGADFAEYDAPTGPACDVTASTTIQAAINIATAGQTVCVPAGTYPEDVNVNKDITLAGAGQATTIINGVTGGQTGALQISANGATVSGFQINAAAGSVAALRILGAHSGATVSFNKITAASGGSAVDTVGGQTNHTFNNNEFAGSGASQLVYINGLASVNVASTNVDFTQNSFTGSAIMALGQEAGSSLVSLNKFSAVTSFTDVEDWEGGNDYSQNNFNDGGLNLQHSENANTGDNGTTDAENNWWGDNNPADGDASADVDFTPFAAAAFPEN
jgi:predicted ribosomally synthesized peptide with SipW-like signal peptide